MTVASRLWPTVCLSSMELNWQSTRPSSVQSELMEHHGDSAPSASPKKKTRWCRPRPGSPHQRAQDPELTGDQGRARLVVLACETGGRWSEEAHDFLRHLARARARSEPREIRAVARRAWFRRWCTALSCCAAQAFAMSLLERRGGLGADGTVPITSDVVSDDRFHS